MIVLAMESATIFISYRRSDAGGYAGRIYDRLATEFGSTAVFMDTASIPPGEEFQQLIQKRVESSSVFLAVMGDDWLAVDAGGTSRMENLNDPVRLEVEAALRNQIRIIPLLVGHGQAVDPARIPATIRQIALLNAIRVSGDMFDESMRRLTRAIEPLAGPAKQIADPAGRSRRRILIVGASAAVATALTAWIFEASRTTGNMPFSVGEMLFVFLVWLAVITSVYFVLEKLRRV
jgi:hypothetical protein